MKAVHHIIILILLALTMPLHAQQEEPAQMRRYADEYAKCEDAQARLRRANDFFAFLHKTGHIDEPVSFPAGSHIDSVDVNVYYYAAEWCYGEGDYRAATDYLTQATKCFGVVDDTSKSDVYALLGAAYFRMSAFDKATEALNHCYELDKKLGDMDRLSSTLNSIASVFVAAGKPQEAEKYVMEAIAANSLTENLTRRAVLYGTASETYRAAGDAEQSLRYAQKALDTERQTGNNARIGVRLSQLASAQMALAKIADARISLIEAIPLLHASGNMHSWGICQNQMGDILACEGKDDEAAKCYLKAATLFLGQGDKYNELHAREGLYKVTKATSPDEAMMHLERAKLLQDPVYQHETGEALGKYNAIYFNDILQKEKERAERQSRTVLLLFAISTALLLAIIALAVTAILRHHRRKVEGYKQDITSLHDQSEQLYRQYQNMVADTVNNSADLTEDDRQFLDELTDTIVRQTSRGVCDVEAMAKQMHIGVGTLRRRLAKSLSTTPKAYIMQVRMQQAKFLLQNYRDITVAEVAEQCGYSQMSNFTRAFTSFFGVAPSALQTQNDKQS